MTAIASRRHYEIAGRLFHASKTIKTEAGEEIALYPGNPLQWWGKAGAANPS